MAELWIPRLVRRGSSGDRSWRRRLDAERQRAHAREGTRAEHIVRIRQQKLSLECARSRRVLLRHFEAVRHRLLALFSAATRVTARGKALSLAFATAATWAEQKPARAVVCCVRSAARAFAGQRLVDCFDCATRRGARMDSVRARGSILHAARKQPERDGEHRAQAHERPHRDARSLAACAEHEQPTLRMSDSLTTGCARGSIAALRNAVISTTRRVASSASSKNGSLRHSRRHRARSPASRSGLRACPLG